jgi:hypothetical protein
VYSKVSYLCACAAFGSLLCAGVYFALDNNTDSKGQALVVEEERDVGPRQIDIYSVEIEVRNGSRQARWIVGMDKG